MLAFLRWLRTTAVDALNSIARFIFIVIYLVVFFVVIGLFQGDGLPSNMVLALDLRQDVPDSASNSVLTLVAPVTVLNTVLALDAAGRDSRVKGAVMRTGSGTISVAQAEELGAAIKRFRATGKFVFVHAQ